MSAAKNNKELQVAAIENGTVIDHIPSNQLFKVASLLELDKMEGNTITIANNLPSKKCGFKGMIKISDKFFNDDEISRIALVAPECNSEYHPQLRSGRKETGSLARRNHRTGEMQQPEVYHQQRTDADSLRSHRQGKLVRSNVIIANARSIKTTSLSNKLLLIRMVQAKALRKQQQRPVHFFSVFFLYSIV